MSRRFISYPGDASPPEECPAPVSAPSRQSVFLGAGQDSGAGHDWRIEYVAPNGTRAYRCLRCTAELYRAPSGMRVLFEHQENPRETPEEQQEEETA